MQCGVPVDLSMIDAPAFIYASREDHIVPWQTAYAGTSASFSPSFPKMASLPIRPLLLATSTAPSAIESFTP